MNSRILSINPTLWGHFAKRGRSADKLRKRAAACATDVTIVLNGAARRPSRPRKWSTFYDATTYADAFRHFRSLGVRVHVMSWVRPDVDMWIRPMVSALSELNERAPFESVLLDAEQEWTRGFPGGRPRARSARIDGYHRSGEAVRLGLLAAGIPYGVTDIGMVSRVVLAPLLDGASYACPQIHEFGMVRRGIRKPGNYVKWMGKHWPGRVPPGCEIRPHLAFYGKRQTPAGLQRSIEACLGRGFGNISGWTSRRFVGAGIRRVLAGYKAEAKGGQRDA